MAKKNSPKHPKSEVYASILFGPTLGPFWVEKILLNCHPGPQDGVGFVEEQHGGRVVTGNLSRERNCCEFLSTISIAVLPIQDLISFL